MQGGTAYRYFLVEDKDTGMSVAGIPVKVDLGDRIVYSDEDGVVAIPVMASEVGGASPGDQRVIRLTELNRDPLETPLSFVVRAQERSYNVEWESEKLGRIGVSFVNVETGSATCIALAEKRSDLAGFDEIQIGRQLRAGAGVEAEVGAKVGMTVGNVKGTKIGVGAGAGAGVEGMLSVLGEDRYGFDYHERTTTEAIAQYILVNDGLIGDLSPELVNLLAYVESEFTGQTVLDNAYVYGARGLDVMGGASGEAWAGAGAFGDNLAVGLMVGADAGVEAHGLLIWAEYPQEDESGISVGITAAGEMGVEGKAGFVLTCTDIGAAAFAGIGAGGEVGGAIELVAGPDGRIGRIELTITTYGRWGYEIGAEFLAGVAEAGIGISRGDAVEATTVMAIEGAGRFLSQLLNTHPVTRILLSGVDRRVCLGGTTFRNILQSLSETAEEIRKAGGALSICREKTISKIHLEQGFEVDVGAGLTSAVRGRLEAGHTINRQKHLIVERAVWMHGRWLVTEQYGDDSYTPDTDLMMSDIVQGIHDDMGSIVQDAFTHIAEMVREGSETIVKAGRATLKVAKDALQAGLEIVVLKWSWWGSSPSAKPMMLSAEEYEIRARIAQRAQEAANLRYGIGGFYALTPENTVLAVPTTFSIEYGDDEVVGIDETTLGMYFHDQEAGQWKLVGGEVNPDSNTVTAQITVFKTYTLAPRIPQGEFRLIPDKASIPADDTTRVSILSDTLRNNDGTPVSDGTLFTLSATGGILIAEDADTLRDGLQVASQGGLITYELRSWPIALPIDLMARSAVGEAIATGQVELTDVTPPLVPVGVQAVQAGERIRVTWSANPELDLAGYRIYYREGQAGPPYDGMASQKGIPSPVPVGTDTMYSLNGMMMDQHYYLALTAYDIMGNESNYSQEFAADLSSANLVMRGDVTGNGIVTAYDASWILQHTVGLRTLTGLDSIAADVSGDSTISAYDASLVLQYVIDKISRFPAEEGHQARVTGDTRTVWIGKMEALSAEGMSLPILIDKMAGVVAGEFTLSFSGIVDDVTVSATDLTAGYLFAYNAQDERIRASFAGTESNTGPGPVLEIMFDGTDSGFLSSLRLERVSLNEGRIPSQIVKQKVETPKAFCLRQNHPNPFNSQTTMSYDVAKRRVIGLFIYGLTGQRIRTLIDGERPAGTYSVTWDGTDDAGQAVASGVYLCRMKAGEYSAVRKLLLVR